MRKAEIWLSSGVLLLAIMLLARSCWRTDADGQSSRGAEIGVETYRRRDLPPSIALQEWYRVAHLRGDVGAPVQIIEFANFLCSYCRALHWAIDSLKARYPGLIAVRWLHSVEPGLTRVGSNRFLAKSAECAADQGLFYEFADSVFSAGPAVASRRGVIGIASRIPSIGQAEFLACLDSHNHEPTLDAHNKLAAQAGIKVTPTWFINGQGIAGTLPFKEIDSIVVAILRGQLP